jgi:hypothetical protein
MPDARVSVLIPAYQAADFIERTLDCARGQTAAGIRILVSIDSSTDATAEICRAHGAEDDRIEVHAQGARLGWAQNVNFLLDRADTEFAFLYFHDDVIEPTYCERLVAALDNRPDAATAHCDVGHFGGSEKLIPGHPFEELDPAVRLIDFLTHRPKPSLLRAMLRMSSAGELRLPTDASGVWANRPFQFDMVAAGPALHVPGPLYKRWDKREGGLTDGWLELPFDKMLAGLRMNAEAGAGTVERLDSPPELRAAALFALGVHSTLRLRRAEAHYEAGAVHPPESLSHRFRDLAPPPALDELPTEIHERCLEMWRRLRRQTERRTAATSGMAG